MTDAMNNKENASEPNKKTGRRKRSTAERAEQLQRSGKNLVAARVKEMLKDHPEWVRLAASEKEERREIHNRRLQVTKRGDRYVNFREKLQNVFEKLEEAHEMEKFHVMCLEETRCHQQLMWERAAARVRRELNLPDPPIAPPAATETRKQSSPKQE